MKNQIKLLVLDIDGTILKKNFTFSTRLKKTIRKAQQKRVRVALTTGRMFYTSLPFAKKLKITEPISCYQGALIKSINGKNIYHHPLSISVSNQILKLAQKNNWSCNFYIDDKLYMTKATTKEAKKYLKIETQFHNNYFEINLDNFKIAKKPTKIIIIEKMGNIKKVEVELKKLLGNKIETTYGVAEFLDIMKKGTNKGTALKELAKTLKVSLKDTMVIGDFYNDISMFEVAGLSVAVKNAPKKVQSYVDFVTDSCENDGAAKAIEKYILEK